MTQQSTNSAETNAWLLAYFRQIYGERVETTPSGAYGVPLTEEKLCEETLHLAVSHDALHWTPLNGNRTTWPDPPNTRVVRDPFVGRGPDGFFHLVATGGTAPRDLYYARSRDFITWEEARSIPVMTDIPQARNVWAPEWVFDEAAGEYFVFWSSSFGEHGWDDSRIWCARTPDFASFSQPRLLFDPGYTVIDATLTQYGETWYMVYKDERFGHRHGEHRFLRVATAPALDGPYTAQTGPVTFSIAEGPAVTRLSNPDRWLLTYDWCMDNRYGASVSEDLLHWQPLPESAIHFPANARHGSLLRITEAECAQLVAHFGT